MLPCVQESFIFSSLLSLAESVSDDCLYTSLPHHAGSHHFVWNSHVRISVAMNSHVTISVAMNNHVTISVAMNNHVTISVAMNNHVIISVAMNGHVKI